MSSIHSTSIDNPFASGQTTTSTLEGEGPGEGEPTITSFAAFDAAKPARALFGRPVGAESETVGLEGSGSKEIEFRGSETQSSGTAKVFFRKIKSAVSGSTTATTQRSISPGYSESSSYQSQKSYPRDNSPAPSSSSTGGGSGQGLHQGGGVTMEILRDDPKISITSYSDAHSRLPGRHQPRPHPVQAQPQQQGMASSSRPPSSQAVNKSEMLKRFGNIADNKVQDSSVDFKRYWMPDKACKECSECTVKFGIFVRRHHCRICGRIFCHSCCSTTIPGAILRPDLQGNLRVCKECCEIFTEFRSSKLPPEMTTQVSDSLSADHTSSPAVKQIGVESPQLGVQGSGNFNRPHSLSTTRSATMNILSPHKSWDDASTGRSQEIGDNSPSRTNAIEFDNPITPSRRRLTGRKPTSFDTITSKKPRESIIILDEDEVGSIASGVWSTFLDPGSGCIRMNHRHRLRNFPDSYTGTDIVNWLLENNHVSSKSAGIQVGQALVDTKRLKIVSTTDSEFKDEINQFLDLGEAAILSVECGNSPVVKDAPKWFQHLPQESDSEYESTGDKQTDMTSSTVSAIPSSSMYKNTILTGSHGDSDKDPLKPSAEDDYLIVGDNQLNKNKQVSTLKNPSPTPARHTPTPRVYVHHEITKPTMRMRYNVARPRELEVGSDVLNPIPTSEDCVSIGSYEPGFYAKAEMMFQKKYDAHLDSSMTQLIKSHGLSLSWLEVIRPLIMKATHTVRTDVLTDDVMDINEYVRIKKIPCGKKSDSSVNFGVVCTKNVTHKKMPTEILNPTILLLKCAFDFQRRENQLSSFDTLHLQENKYLQNLVDKVKAFKPSIILVQKSVSRLALEDLYSIGIIVVVNVKPNVMSRVARSTQGEILTSLDQLFFDVRLGTCGKFYLRNFTLENTGIKRTLMYFDGCDPKLGCAISLQGGSKRELKKVKKVIQFGLHVAFNSLLEMSFLLDEYAWCAEPDSPNSRASDDYISCSVTPELLLYPSLAYPLDSLPPAELVKRLKALEVKMTDSIDGDSEAVEKNPSEGGGEGIEVEDLSNQTDEGVNIEKSSAAPQNKENESEVESVVKSSDTGLPSSSVEKNEQSCLVANTDATSPQQVDSHTGQEVTSHVSLTENNPQTRAIEGHSTFPSESGSNSMVGSEVILEEIDSGSSLIPPPPEDDPLSMLNKVSNECLSQLSEQEFASAMDKQLLSISPNVKFTVPYLQTARGREADVRQYLPSVIYWSFQFKCSPKKVQSDKDGVLEMGLTKELALKTSISSEKYLTTSTTTSNGEDCDPSQLHGKTLWQHHHHCPSYKSVSEHPLTNSILILKANSNEMKAALADYRSRAGLVTEDNSFFFLSARVAADYRLHLKNVFNKYDRFGADSEREEEEMEETAENSNNTEGCGQSETTPNSVLPSTTTGGESKEGVVLTPVGEDSQKLEVKVDDTESSKEIEKIRSQSRSRSFNSPGHELGSKIRNMTLEDMDRNRVMNSEEKNANFDLDFSYNTWLTDIHTDCLDPIKHQGLSVLFSNNCHDGQKHLRPCVPPCIIPMFYYGHNDMAIGDFLQRYCFREHYRCQTCSVDMAKHTRHIIHGHSALHITIQNAHNDLPGKENMIYTWLCCTLCDNVTPYTMMPPNSLLFSFAKFLELRFYCNSYVTCSDGGGGRVSCGHSLHKDYVQCFMYRNKLATFSPSPIVLIELMLPPQAILITTPRGKYHHNYTMDIKHVGRIVEGVFYRIHQKLDKYRLEPVSGQIDDLISNSKAERGAMRAKVKHLKELVVSSGGVTWESEQVDLLGDNISNIQDELEDMKRCITEVVECSNIVLEELDVKIREHRKRMRELGEVVTVDGLARSPRDSPVATIQSVFSSDNTNHTRDDPKLRLKLLSPTPPVDTPLSDTHDTSSNLDFTPTNQSPVLGNTLENRDFLAKRYPPIQGLKHHLAPPSSPTSKLKLSHERNHSDGGGVASGAEVKVHRRNLSDSQSSQIQKEGGSPLLESATDTSRSNLSTSPGTSFNSKEYLGDMSAQSSSPTSDNGTPQEDRVGVVTGGGGGGRKRSGEYQTIKTIDQSSHKVDGKSGGGGGGGGGGSQVVDEEALHVDNAGGFLAKLRGKEQDVREDPTKFYLLDPYLITTGGAPAPTKPPQNGANGNSTGSSVPHDSAGKSGAKRHATSQKKSTSGISASTAEAYLDGKVDKKSSKDKDRFSILARQFQKLPPPFEYDEHHTMRQHSSVPVAIYEKEPTSIISYALSSREYFVALQALVEKNATKYSSSVAGGGGGGAGGGAGDAKALSPKTKKILSEPEKAPPPSTAKGFFNDLKKKGSAMNIFSGLTSSNTSSPHDVMDPFEHSETYSRRVEGGKLTASVKSSNDAPSSDLPSAVGGGIGGDETDLGKSNRGHISLEFSNPEKTSNFFCKVYFAEEFRKLRERIFPSGENRFIRSLTRCVKYDAKGGKSRSAFCKVADDRFILKQIKSIEISAFEDFAPRYLDYITRAIEEKRPLALAKILGAYSIGYKNSKTGSSKRMDVVVMENLLYQHNTSRVFDLKGSMRSRYIDPGKDIIGEVLLDENYLNSICHNPVYVYPHSKFVLMQALLADSEFLAQNSIMDYSLLTCIDDDTGMLVVGIIDYVRTFTFDKRLEMYLKKTSGKELPTVVYPELYRKRFCDAMERYFTVVPDKWSGLGVDFDH